MEDDSGVPDIARSSRGSKLSPNHGRTSMKEEAAAAVAAEVATASAA